MIPFVAYAQNDQITEVCGVKFGSSLSSAKAILKDKFGEADTQTDDAFLYLHKNYGGIAFDIIAFYFTKSGSKTYLNKVVFSVVNESKAEAEKERERIAEAVKKKYTLTQKKDSNGNIEYYGGTSPLNSNKYGFFIAMSKTSTFEKYPWEARLEYGGYGYGEDF